MRMVVILTALALGVSQAGAECAYNADYVEELRSLGLNQQAFQYALTWAGSGNPDAEYEVALSLVEGRGVTANPLAAIKYACGNRQFDGVRRDKIIIQGNLRLASAEHEPVRCKE